MTYYGRALSNKFAGAHGILSVDDVEIPITFNIKLGNICPSCQHKLTGHITYAQMAPELVTLLDRSRILTSETLYSVLFSISGIVVDASGNLAQLKCENCYFIDYDDLSEIGNEASSCDLLFTVINPNIDFILEWGSGHA